MPRRLGFDREQARDAIMRTFWLQGYEGTGLTDLERATSLVRTSLYNAFGNKPDMFLDSLTLYRERIEMRIDAAMTDAGTEALCEVVAAMIEGRDKAAGQPAGCLMVGAALQTEALDDRHLRLVRGYRRMLATKAVEALERDRIAGKLDPTLDIDGAAELLVCIVWGALAAQCLADGDSKVAAAVPVLRSTVAGWLTG